MKQELRQILAEARAIAELERKRKERIAKRAGQGRASWQVLSVAQRSAGTVPQLARRLGLSRQSVQRVVDRLAESGLARFEPNPDHERSPRIRLTEAGESTLQSLERAASAAEPDLHDELEEEEVETTLQVLRALRAVL